MHVREMSIVEACAFLTCVIIYLLVYNILYNIQITISLNTQNISIRYQIRQSVDIYTKLSPINNRKRPVNYIQRHNNILVY